MIKYKKVYCSALGYDPNDNTQYIQSELSPRKSVDLHHIVNREDRIENLMALTREEHLKYGEVKSKMWFLLDTHREFLISQGVSFENEWFKKMMGRYEAYIND